MGDRISMKKDMPNDPFLFLQATKEECNELLRSLTPAETSILNPLISSVVSLCPAIEDSRKRFKRLSTSYATTIREVESMQTHMHDIHTNVTKCTATNEPLQHDDAAPQDATDRLDELLTEDIFNKNSSMDDEHITPEIHITKTARRVRASYMNKKWQKKIQKNCKSLMKDILASIQLLPAAREQGPAGFGH